MAKKTFKMFMTKGVGAYNRDEIELTRFDPIENPTSTHGLAVVLLGVFDVDLEVPEVDTRSKEIEMLENSIKQERAESQIRVNAMLDQISKLQCLEHKSEH